MKIDGKQIAADIFSDLKVRVEKLKEKNITPHLYMILLSNDASSTSYINQKIKRGEEIGVKITLDKQNPNISSDVLVNKIENLNNNKNVNAIIVQRPMPSHLDENIIAESILPQKDIDGFGLRSPYKTPVAAAVLKLLETTHPKDFENWLRQEKIAVVGKGVTAGGPIIKSFQRIQVEPSVISSKTQDRKEILKSSDIVISAVGKPDVIKADELKENAIVIGVGLHMEEDGKFHGDFNEEEVLKISSFYSPTPGGVGPVNVSMLLSNLVTAAEKS